MLYLRDKFMKILCVMIWLRTTDEEIQNSEPSIFMEVVESKEIFRRGEMITLEVK